MAKRVPLDRLREISKQRPIRRTVDFRRLAEVASDPDFESEWPIEAASTHPEDIS